VSFYIIFFSFLVYPASFCPGIFHDFVSWDILLLSPGMFCFFLGYSTFLNPIIFCFCILVYTGIFWFFVCDILCLGGPGIYWYILLVCPVIFYVLCPGIYWYILFFCPVVFYVLCPGIYWYILLFCPVIFYVLCPGIYWYILLFCPVIFYVLRLWIFYDFVS
jgi:hypothetical protein